jgi:uncharacterized protein (DUF1697 family)
VIRYIAFLRAINVGGHIVKMERLRVLFEEMGLAKVETFIASGNVIFESSSKNEEALRKKIEKQLQQALGYEVGVFLRSDKEVSEIAAYQPFPPSELDASGVSLYIVFLATKPITEAERALMAARNEVDDFKLHGRELYWLCRKNFSDSKFSGPRLEKTLGLRGTARNSTTVRKLAAKYPV